VRWKKNFIVRQEKHAEHNQTMEKKMKKYLTGFTMGLLIFGMTAMSDAATQTFDFEAGGAGTQTTEGYSTLGWGSYYLWSSGSTVSQNFTQSGGNTIDLTFNLAIIDTWDGTNASWGSPDYFNYALDGNVIFSETFINYANLNSQTYHGSAPITWGSSNFAMYNSYHPDSAYMITLSGLTSAAGSHTLSFFASGSGWQGSYNPSHPEWIPNPWDESFAVDNIRVSYQDNVSVPEPSTILLLGIGFLGMVTSKRRKA
jgi:hypothetical protein